MKLRTLVYFGLTGLLMCTSAMAAFEYEGERNAFNRFHGKGKFTSTQGVVYEGDWVDGRREGQGIETGLDGERYEGSWSGNREHGQGKRVWPNGDTYDGQWAGGRMQGMGTFTAASGERYTGGFAANLRHGKGVLVTASGERHEGTWKEGKRNGQFRITLKDGSVATGQWVDDRAPATATVELADGQKYTGPVRAGAIPNGKGTCVRAGQSGPCEFRDGRLQAAAVAVAPPKPEPKPQPKAVPKAAPKAVAPVVAAPRAAEVTPVEAPAAPKDPRTLRGVRADGSQFFFRHSYGGNGYSDNIPTLQVEKDLNEFGAMRISARGGEFDITLTVDEYVGESTYELRYFKATIQKKGDAVSYRTSSDEPGKLVILKDDGKNLIGMFSFTGYPNGAPGADKRTVAEGEFVIPLR